MVNFKLVIMGDITAEFNCIDYIATVDKIQVIIHVDTIEKAKLLQSLIKEAADSHKQIKKDLRIEGNFVSMAFQKCSTLSTIGDGWNNGFQDMQYEFNEDCFKEHYFGIEFGWNNDFLS